MSIFRSIFKGRMENRAAGTGPRFFFGQSAAGKSVTESTAMQMAAVYACVRVLSESIAALPLHVYKRGENGDQEKAEEHPLFFLLHDEPNPEMSSYTLRETLMAHLLLYGNAFAQILRNGRGEVVALYPLMPNRMSVERDEKTGRLFYRYTRYDAEPPTMEQNTVILDAADVLHIPGLSFDGLVGMSPIAACRNAVGAGLAADEYSSKYYANGAAPMGILETPTLIKNPEFLRQSWNEAFGGSRNAGKVAVLEQGTTFKPISLSPQDSQLLETRKFSVEEICRIFRVPPHMVQNLERATFNNTEQMSLDFVMYSLTPWIIRWEQGLSRSLLSREEKKQYSIRFNVDGLLRGDYKSRMEGYAVGINNGFICPNDVRRLEGFDLIPAEKGGENFLIQGAMVKLEDAGIYAAKKENK
jgi:HK97 family phage portal protein